MHVFAQNYHRHIFKDLWQNIAEPGICWPWRWPADRLHGRRNATGVERARCLPCHNVGWRCAHSWRGHKVFAGEPLVLVSAGHRHTAGVTKDGALWSWGKRQYGQLGHGDGATRQCQERMSREMLGGSPAVVVACGGDQHTLVLIWAACGAAVKKTLADWVMAMSQTSSC